MTIRIYTYADRRPDFIRLQKASFDAFVRDDFEFLVFNSGSTPELVDEIDATCRGLGIDSERVPQHPAGEPPSVVCGRQTQWSFQERIRFDDNVSVMVDSDIFLLRPFSFRDHVGDDHISAVKQRRRDVRYLWPGLVILDTPELPEPQLMDWMPGSVDGVRVDVGGMLNSWLIATKDSLRLRNIGYTGDISRTLGNLFCLPPELRERYDDSFCFQIYERAFLHYKRGNNWDGQPSAYHDRKSALLSDLIDGCRTGTLDLPDYTYEFKFPEPDGNGEFIMNYWESVDGAEPFDDRRGGRPGLLRRAGRSTGARLRRGS